MSASRRLAVTAAVVMRTIADGTQPCRWSGARGHSHGATTHADRGKLAIALGLIVGFMAVEVAAGPWRVRRR